MFDYVNLPANGAVADEFGCTSSYVSIASLYRPNEDYRLCGQRRGVKLITTYNVVLIKFVTTNLKNNPAFGFSLIFRLIMQKAASPSRPPVGVAVTPSSPAKQFFVPSATTRYYTPPTTTTLAMLTSPRFNPYVTSPVRTGLQ